MKPLIQNYSDIESYLFDVLSYRKQKNRYYSIRSFAKSLGFSSHSSLGQVLSGKRSFPLNKCSSLCKNLKLSKDDQIYLIILLHKSKLSSIEEEYFYIEITKYYRENINFL